MGDLENQSYPVEDSVVEDDNIEVDSSLVAMSNGVYRLVGGV